MPSINDLKRAIAIQEKLDALNGELSALLGDWSSSGTGGKKRGRTSLAASSLAKPVRKKRRKLSPEALEKIREGQRRRWAKVKKAQKAEAKA